MCFEEGKMLLNRFWQAMLCFLLTMMAIGRLATEKPGMRPLNLSKHARTHTQSFHIPLCHVVQRLHREVHPSLNHLHCIKTQSAFVLKDCAIWASGLSKSHQVVVSVLLNALLWCVEGAQT